MKTSATKIQGSPVFIIWYINLILFSLVKRMCKVMSCYEKDTHQTHFCRICCKNDVDHFARNCPSGIIAYHGTTSQRAAAIKNTTIVSFKARHEVDAIYFTTDKKAAHEIAEHRAKAENTTPAVLQYIIPNPQKIKDKNICFHDKHGKWQGVTSASFDEYGVKCPNRIRLIKMQEFIKIPSSWRK